MTPPAAGWDAEAAARELEREWMLASSLAEQRAIIARHLTLARAAAPSAEAMRRCIEQFADHKNWYDAVGCLQWMGKRHAIDYAESVLSALPPAQPPTQPSAEAMRERLREVDECLRTGSGAARAAGDWHAYVAHMRAIIAGEAKGEALPPAQPPTMALSSIPAAEIEALRKVVTVELERDEWNHRVATHLRSFLARIQSPTPAGEADETTQSATEIMGE